ncbi:MAG: fused MFS/spermidine synthase, partial [Alphaproteobacteria bacterium]|nr:fused MFS/spermidine synthase [Alphaproteobacteria bacterium]
MATLELPRLGATPSAAQSRIRLLCVLFFFSGFPALIYQLTWQRSLFRIFGVNTESVTIVVTAFMVGLGLGSLAGGWVSRRSSVKPLLLLGAIELLTAAFGLISLALFEEVSRRVPELPLFALAAINLLLVIVPTLLMGATLPILVAHLVKSSGRIGNAVGTLYFVNTLGAGAACLVCAVLIFPFLGMQAAVRIAAAINIAVGVGAIAAHLMRRDASQPVSFAPARPAQAPVLGLRFVLLLAALGGFISLSYEIFLFRMVSYATGSSSLAFALTLSAFLVGIAGGARSAASACDRFAPNEAMWQAAKDLILGNIFGALFLPVLASFAFLDRAVVGIALPLVYLVARQWGALLPYLSQFGIAADNRAGMQTALLYFANIVGCAIGAVLTGFVLTNWLGGQAMAGFLLAGGTLCALLLIAVLRSTPREQLQRSGLAVAVLGFGVAAITLLAPRVYENLQAKGAAEHAFAQIVENRSGIIAVDTEGKVYGNGMYDGRFSTSLRNDVNGIVRPYALSLFHPAPRDVLMIGLAAGSWAQVVANNPSVQSVTIVEINRGYVDLIAQHDEVSSLLRNPKVRIITDDGRRWLNRHPEQHFDAILADVTFHFRANATNVLSTGFLEIIKRHLNPGGIYFYNTTLSRR